MLVASLPLLAAAICRIQNTHDEPKSVGMRARARIRWLHRQRAACSRWPPDTTQQPPKLLLAVDAHRPSGRSRAPFTFYRRQESTLSTATPPPSDVAATTRTPPSRDVGGEKLRADAATSALKK